MGIIPEYQRRQLASSLVGTPGIDRSGQMIAESVSQAVGNVTNSLMGLAAQRQEAKDLAFAQKTLLDFDLRAEETEKTHKQGFAEFRGDPMEPVKVLRSSLESNANSVIESMPSGGARSLVERNIWSSVKQRVEQSVNYYDGKDSIDMLKQKMSNTATNKDLTMDAKKLFLQEYLRQGEQVYAVQGKILGPENKVKLQEYMRSELPKSYIVAAIDDNPAEAITALKSGWFDKILTPEERAKYKNDAVSALAAQKEKTEILNLATNISQNNTMFQKYVNNTLTYEDIQAMPDKLAADKLNQMRLKAKPYNIAEKQAKYMDLYGEVMSPKMVKGEGEKAKYKAPFNEALNLQRRIIDAVNEGELDAEQGSSLLKKFNIPNVKKINEFKLFPDNSTFGRAYDFVKKEGAKNKLAPSIQTKALVNFDREMEKLGENPPADLADALRKAYVDAVRVSRPELVQMQGTPNRILNPDRTSIKVSTGKTDVKNPVRIPPKNMKVGAGVGDVQFNENQKAWYKKEEDGSWALLKN